MPNIDPATEQRILAAAHAVFLRRGTTGARMQEIADEAGVNKALLHYYFRSKDGLARAVFSRAVQELFSILYELLSSPLPLEEKVRLFVEREIDFLVAHPYLPGYVLSELHHHPERIIEIVEVVGTPPRAALEAQLAEAAARGAIRPVSAQEFVVNLVALVVFPFAGRLMIEALLGIGDAEFAGFVEQRRQRLPAFILNALRP